MPELGADAYIFGYIVGNGVPFVQTVQKHGLDALKGQSVLFQEAACLIVLLPYHPEYEVLNCDGCPACLYGFFAGIPEDSVYFLDLVHVLLNFKALK